TTTRSMRRLTSAISSARCSGVSCRQRSAMLSIGSPGPMRGSRSGVRSAGSGLLRLPIGALRAVPVAALAVSAQPQLSALVWGETTPDAVAVTAPFGLDSQRVLQPLDPYWAAGADLFGGGEGAAVVGDPQPRVAALACGPVLPRQVTHHSGGHSLTSRSAAQRCIDAASRRSGRVS